MNETYNAAFDNFLMTEFADADNFYFLHACELFDEYGYRFTADNIPTHAALVSLDGETFLTVAFADGTFGVVVV